VCGAFADGSDRIARDVTGHTLLVLTVGSWWLTGLASLKLPLVVWHALHSQPLASTVACTESLGWAFAR